MWFTLSEKNVLQNFIITVNVVLNVYNVVLHATNIMWLQTLRKECDCTPYSTRLQNNVLAHSYRIIECVNQI